MYFRLFMQSAWLSSEFLYDLKTNCVLCLKERYYFLCPFNKITLSDMSSKQAQGCVCCYQRANRCLFPIWGCSFHLHSILKLTAVLWPWQGEELQGFTMPRYWRLGTSQICVSSNHTSFLTSAQLIKQCTPRTLRLLWMFLSLSGQTLLRKKQHICSTSLEVQENNVRVNQLSIPDRKGQEVMEAEPELVAFLLWSQICC